MLEYLRLVNVCQHTDKEVTLGPGLTVVVGRQGSGKTNFFTMGLASLVGDNPLHGNKSENIRRGAKGLESYVESRWSAKGRTVEILRGYQKSKSQVFVDGELVKEARREAEVTQVALETLGIDKDSLRDFCVVPQGDTDALIEALPTDRVRFVARFLEQQWMLALEEPVKQAVRSVRLKLGEDYLSQLSTHWLANRQAMAQRDRLSREVADKQQEIEMLQERLKRHELAISQLDQLDEHRLHLEGLRRQLAELTPGLSLGGKIPDREAQVQQVTMTLENAKQWSQLVEQERERSQLLARQSNITEEIARLNQGLVPPDEPQVKDEADPSYLEDIRQHLAGMRRRVSLLKQGKSECETCGSPIVSRPGELDELVAVGQAKAAELERLEAISRQWVQYQSLASDWERRAVTLRQRHAAVSAELVELGDRLAKMSPPVQIPPAVMAAENQPLALSSRLGALQSQLTQWRTQYEHACQSQQRLTGEIQAAESRVAQLEAAVSPAAREEIEQLKTWLRGGNQWLAEYSRQLGGEQERFDHTRSEVRRCLEAVRSQRQYLLLQERLEELLIQVGPRELPRATLVQLMRAVGQRMSELCYELGQPFEVRIGDDLDFVIRHADGSVESAKRLSGGQKACVATVFWLVRLMARNESSLPLLILDEPSANMDAAAVARFGEMLSRLNHFLVARGLQVVLITHHEQLIGCGQQVVRVGG